MHETQITRNQPRADLFLFVPLPFPFPFPFFFFPFFFLLFFLQAIKEIYSMDATKAKEMAAERRKNGTIEMSAARMASMMDEGREAGGDVPIVKVRSLNS